MQTAQWRYGLSGASVLLLTLLLAQAPVDVGPTGTALLYLLVVLISATTFGRGPAVAASLLAFLASNFFFTAPRYTLSIASPRDLLSLVTFLAVAISTSGLAGRVRWQATIAQERTRELTTLYTLSQTISAEVDLDRILPVIARTTCALLGLPSCRILLYDERGIKVTRASYGTEPAPGRTVDTVLKVGSHVVGSLQVSQPASAAPLTPAEHERLALVASQIVLVVERARLVHEAGLARSLGESDRLKAVLLASVSHDLRTPLAIIKGAATNLLDESVAWDASARRDMLLTLNEETDRLNRLVGNLLEMSRIEAGALSQTRTWQDAGELVEIVLARLRPRLAERPLQVTIAPDLPLARMNVAQIDQVLTNLLENAGTHTPPHSAIAITVSQLGDALQIVVQDTGPGIPPEIAAHIFERFVRGAAAERHAEGSGLGLAIARGLVEAHGGRLWVNNLPGGGAAFAFTLPLAQHTAPGAPQHARETEQLR